jgi:tetratricopeptide (TPR) repeat protein
MKGRILAVLICFFAVCVQGQSPDPAAKADKPSAGSDQQEDLMQKYLADAERYQRSGDLSNAEISNRAVLGVALQRMGIVAIEEGKFPESVRHLTGSAAFSDTASTRTNLAIAYMRQNLLEEALLEARAALRIDPDHFGAHYILANVFYTQEDYPSALPELEYVFAKSPDFEIARALGFTYLSLKQIEKARTHFDQTLALLKVKNPEIHLLFAKFYERTNYPADAERELKKALALDAKAPKINLYLGYLLMQNGGSGRLGEALEAFERELKVTPNDFYPNFFAGVAATSNNENEKAIQFLKRAIEIKPESGEAHLFLAQSQLAIDDLADAEKNLRRAVELESTGKKNTQSRRTHFLLGRLLVKTGKEEEGRKELMLANQLQKEALDSSRTELDRILGQVAEGSDLESGNEKSIEADVKTEIDPKRAEQLDTIKKYLSDVITQSYTNLGVIATQNNRPNEAVKYFSTAYGWNPDFPNLGRNLGIVRFRNAEFEASIVPLAKQLKTNPDDTTVRKLLGTSYYLTGKYGEAVKTLEPIETLLLSDAELAYPYGFSLVQIKRNKDAISVFDRMAKTSGQSPEALLSAAQGLMISGEYQRAIAVFESVLKISPNVFKANYYIGQCLLRLNRLTEAADAFEREIEVSPSDPLPRYHLALSLIERRVEADRAVRLLEDAISLNSGYADAHYQLGKIFLERGENEKAIVELERAVAADPKKDYVHYQLSIAYRKASRMEDSERELKIYQQLKEEKRQTDTPMAMGDENTPEIQ